MTRAGMELDRLTHTAVEGFDYSTLTPEAARQARAAADAINRIVVQNYREVGRHLRNMKELLPHGAFVEWCKKALNVTPRSAQNYMAAAEWLDGKSETLSLLPATVVYALAAPSAPAEVVQEVVAAAEAGSMPEPAVISHKIEVARAEERAVKQELAKKPGRTEADARKSVAKKRETRARDRENQLQEAARANAGREARRARQHKVAQILVAAHREVVAEMVAAAKGDAYGLLVALEAALEAAGSGR